jgi:polar amino acid transport system substrate-binding protein
MRTLSKTVLTLAIAAAAAGLTFPREIGEQPMAATEVVAGVPLVPLFLDPALVGAPTANPPQALRFLTADDFPPFNFIDGRGRLGGYHIELARAICRELDIPCTIQARPFHTLAQSLADNAGDAIVAGVRDTPGLRRFLTFTDSYLRVPGRFAAAADAEFEATPEGLAGRTIAAVAGTPHVAFLAAFFPASRIVTFADADAAVTALADGTAEAVFADGLSLSFWLSGPAGSACCGFVGGPYIEAGYFGEGLRIAVGRDDTALADLLDKTLASLEARGVMAELYLKYFPLGLY